jgi:hypothetical protein
MAVYSALGPVQDAVYKLVEDAMKADATVKSTLGALFDQAPTGQAFPYVTLGDGDHETNVDDFDGPRRDVTVVLTAWTGVRSFRVTSAMVSALVNCIANADTTMAVTGWTVDQIHYDGAGPKLRDPDGIARQIPVAFTITVDQN